MKEIKFRKVLAEDCDDVFRWLNDKETLNASFHSDPVPYETHKQWFAGSLKNPQRHIYLAEEKDGNKIGVVRLDRSNEQVAEFAINLAPEMRGKGYGAELIQVACRRFVSDIGGCFFLARIKKSNPASIKVFKKAGFFEIFNYSDAKWGSVIALGKIAEV